MRGTPEDGLRLGDICSLNGFDSIPIPHRVVRSADQQHHDPSIFVQLDGNRPANNGMRTITMDRKHDLPPISLYYTELVLNEVIQSPKAIQKWRSVRDTNKPCAGNRQVLACGRRGYRRRWNISQTRAILSWLSITTGIRTLEGFVDFVVSLLTGSFGSSPWVTRLRRHGGDRLLQRKCDFGFRFVIAIVGIVFSVQRSLKKIRNRHLQSKCAIGDCKVVESRIHGWCLVQR
jgi:hypothetical protein